MTQNQDQLYLELFRAGHVTEQGFIRLLKNKPVRPEEKGTRKQQTRKRRNAVTELLKEDPNMSALKIAKRIGCCAPTIYKDLKALGIKRKIERKPITNEVRSKVLGLFNAGWSQTQISMELEINSGTVWNIINQATK
jgi:DNA invertase Pin-like site-specific DNA recombinase